MKRLSRLAVMLMIFLTGEVSEAAEPPVLQSKIKGLLVIELADGSHAGAASQMNATAVPASDPQGFGLRFNQDVGEMMNSATNEVEKLMRVRHPETLPLGHTIEFGFEDKHTPKDGPSAAVACALMTESIITGVGLDQKFGVTGDITATGEVRPVGGVDAKVRGASRRDCEIFAVPAGNKISVEDLYITEGLEAISRIQIILIKDIEEALAIGRLEKSPEIRKALEEFALVSKAVESNPRNSSHPKVLEKLKTILQVLPGHESARLIALDGLGKAPKRLSLSGSLSAIERGASRLASSIDDGSFMETGMDDPLWSSLSTMEGLRNKIDRRTRPYLESYLSTAAFLKEHRQRSVFTAQLQREFREVISNIKSQRTKLRNDKELQEEMMDE